MKSKLIASGGILLILFGIFHLSFWNIFAWDVELSKLSIENSNIMQMLNIGTICLLLCLGCILIFYRSEVANTQLGKVLLLTLSLFYLVRLIIEFIFPESSAILGLVLFLCVLIFLFPTLMKNK